MPSPRPRHWTMLCLLAAIYGGAFLMNKQALTALSPATIVLARLVIGFAFLAPLAALLRRPMPHGPRAWTDIAVLGVMGNALPFCLVAWGQQIVPSAIAGILMAIIPVVIILLAHIALPEEPLTRTKLAGFALAFAGTVMLIGPGRLTSLGGNAAMLVHELAILGGALAYAAMAVYTRRAAALDPVSGGAAAMLVAAILTAPFAPHAFHEIAAARSPALIAVLLLGVFPTGLAIILYIKIIREAGAGFYAIANYLVPLWAAFLGASLGMEHLPGSALAALALILGGVAVVQIKPRSHMSGAADAKHAAHFSDREL